MNVLLPRCVSRHCQSVLGVVAGVLGAAGLSAQPPSLDAALDLALPTVFIVGDSTAANGGGSAVGWGRPFSSFFDSAKINIANRARGGRSSRTYLTEGFWDRALEEVKAGDVVLLQFGHNDLSAVNDDSRARGTLPGIGDETEAIDNLLTKQPEVVRTFGSYMKQFVTDVRAKGATPVLLSLTVRNIWTDGKVERGASEYGAWTRELARATNTAFIDLTTLVADEYERLGEERVKAFFPRDHTHTTAEAAELNARYLEAGLKAMPGLPIAAALSSKGDAVPPAPAASVAAARPRSRGPEPADPSLPTLFLIGDSTVRNGRGDGSNGQWGWGEPLAAFFDPSKINVVNRAVGGLSSRTFLTGGHWERVMAMLKPGDFIIMQFGHNDDGALNDEPPGPLRARGTIRGTGEETRDIDNVLTKQHEVVHTYGWYLRRFITDSRSKGAIPIVASLVPRKRWADGRIIRNRDDYAGWAEEVARTLHVSFLDLNERIAARYDALGQAKVDALFADAHTHTSRSGAELNAEVVVSLLKALPENPLGPYFSSLAHSVAPATP